jgi:uncharacterized membrane protein
MDGVQSILSSLDVIEVLVIKMSSTVSVLIFCYIMTRNHVERIGAKRKKQKDVSSEEQATKIR